MVYVVDFGPAAWYPEAEALKIKKSFGGRGFRKVSSEKVSGTTLTVYRTPEGDKVELLENPRNDNASCHQNHSSEIRYYDKNSSYKPLKNRFPGHNHCPDL